jgi:TetR/AcrR family transcriptional repressor of nem operon
MPQRAQQKAESRAAILQSAADLIRVAGAEGTSVQQAMKGAGLTVGAFYAHFADKTELIDAAYKAAVDEMTARVLSVSSSPDDTSALLPVVTEYLSEQHRDNPTLGCPLPAILGEASHHGSPLTTTSLADGFTQMRDAFMSADPNLDRDEADALLALLVGSQIIARALKGSPLSHEVLEAAQSHARSTIAANSLPSP